MEGIYFDPTEANFATQFFESLTLTKSTRSGMPEPMYLLPHNRKLVTNLFGWRRPNGARLYRKVFYTVARKNTKTQTAAAVGLYLLCDPREMAPEIYVAAKDRDQASYCYEAAEAMVNADPGLRENLIIKPSYKTIINPANNGKMKALSSEGKTKHGSNPSAVIIDEFHVWGEPERELYDALTTGSGARRDPLLIIITTAGVDEQSMCYLEYKHAKRVLEGKEEDPTYLPIMYELPKDADWSDESLWPLANPALAEGVISLESLREERARALAMPSEQNKFRRLYCNQWVNAAEQWIPMHAWDACAGTVDFDYLQGHPCYGGLDLGAVDDLTAFVLAWPIGDAVYVYPWFFMPSEPHGEPLREKCRRDNVRYDLWAKDGYIELTPGSVTDWRFVKDRIAQLAQRFTIREIGFDRYGARDTAADLSEQGLSVVDTGQGYISMSAPSKRLEELVISRKLVHSGHPVLRWNIDCCTIESDAAGNIKPVKPDRKRSSKRIDGVVATVMANDRVMRNTLQITDFCFAL